MALNPDSDLGEARAAIDRRDAQAALKHLDRARRGYLKQHDVEGLEHVLDMSALVGGEDEERARVGRENLAYAAKQNLRQESRRRAQLSGEAWDDPYPALEAPTEHTGIHLGPGAKLAIGVGVALGTLAVAGYVALIVVAALSDEGTHRVTLQLLNDTPATISVKGCEDEDCDTTWLHERLDPGQAAEGKVPVDDLVDLFKVKTSGHVERCLPVRIHDAFKRYEGQGDTFSVTLSRATACPGATVLPRPSAPIGGL